MRLDHVNVRTGDLEAMRAFFEEVVGLEVGDRPPFDFPGYWLYSEGEAVVHLVGIDASKAETSAGPVDHFAFRGGDYATQKSAVERAGLRFRENDVPGTSIRQIFVSGPEGVRVELQFKRP